MANVYEEFIGRFCLYKRQINPLENKIDRTVPAIPVAVFQSDFMANLLRDECNKLITDVCFVEPIEDLRTDVEPVSLPFE